MTALAVGQLYHSTVQRNSIVLNRNYMPSSSQQWKYELSVCRANDTRSTTSDEAAL